MTKFSMPSTPTTGVHFSREDIQKILTSLRPPQDLSTFEATELGFNNRIYMISTACGSEGVLKAGGRYWKRQKTEAEVAGLLALARTRRDVITVPRVLGFSSRTSDSLPWEWILLQRLPGENMRDVWGTFNEAKKEDVARKLGNIVVSMQSITPAELGFRDKQPQYGNISLTRPEDGATAPGHDHTSFDLSSSSSQPLYVSHMLNGPPPSATYLTYASALIVAAIESLERPAQYTRFAYQLNAERLPRLRHCADRLRTDPTPLLRAMNTNQRWRPVFTHGDLLPQNILVHEGMVFVIDWEWCGFFPPHVEWDAGLNALVALLASSSGGRAKEVFLEVIHKAGASTPWSIPPAEWELAMKLMRLTECVVPWWLDGYPDDGGETEEARKEVTEKRDAVVLELDELLDFFGA